ncbi:MAG: hypothetical protein ACI9EB_001285 [Pseudomonas sp.]|jgi:hypothetical protein
MTMRQPDIEIYVKDAEHQAIAAWLSEAIGPCSEWQKKGQTYQCNAGNIAVTWLPKAVGKWHSLLLGSDATPWADDLECAQAAFAALKVEIRCAPGSWQEEESEEQADRWMRISVDGVEEITWHTA